MKRYKDSIVLIISNIIFEYILILATYFICGLVRIYVPVSIGRKFYLSTIGRFTPFILIVDIFIICLFFVMGDYYSIHFRNAKRIFFEAFVVAFLGGVVGSAVLFFIDGSQFSRILLIMVVPSWCIVISIKRFLCEKIATRIFSNKISSCKVLIVGTDSNARGYYYNLKTDAQNSTRYIYVGYIADVKNEFMDSYLGDISKLYEVISANEINKVVISADGLTKDVLNNILSICAVFGIECFVIPVYADYIYEGQKVKVDNGLHVINVNAFNTSSILGVNVSVTDMDKTIRDIEANLEKWRGEYVCVSNVHTTVMAYDDPDYRQVQNGAVMALPDGGPLSSYSRSEGKKEAKRVTGPDLMREILIRSGEHGWTHFFYGSTQKTLDMLKEKIEKVYPGAKVVGMISPPFRELSPEEDMEYVELINSLKPDFVWVGLGAPKQEIWMSAHKGRIDSLMIGVGAAFDYESGNLKRAPKWMQKCSLEWLYRFMQEPRRLFKRYFVTNIKFLWLTRR